MLLTGLAVRRVLPSTDDGLAGLDQDVIAFDQGGQDSRIVTCLLDGGAAERTQGGDAARGKDCIDAENTGATADNPVIIENNEIRFCYDRGIHSPGYLRAERNWIHNNLRGGR